MLKPEQMTVVIDSREKTPLSFEIKGLKIPTQIGSMPTGDYTLLHLEDEICIERKSLPDLLGCIGRDRIRFEKELHRLMAYPVRALVIESNWKTIEGGNYYKSKVSPQSVIGSLLSWQHRYGIPIMMLDNQERASRFVARFFYSFAKSQYLKMHKLLGGQK